MADLNLSQMATRVLQKLSVLTGGETASAEDDATAQAGILAVNEKLRDMGVCYWSDAAFPLAIKEDFASYVACHVAGEFLIEPGAALQFQQANEGRSLANLRALSAAGRRFDVQPKAIYF